MGAAAPPIRVIDVPIAAYVKKKSVTSDVYMNLCRIYCYDVRLSENLLKCIDKSVRR